jgi:hypothetical protein
VVSDSHLSERTPEASANWGAVVDDVAADAPDLVVHTGDISADGARLPADLATARRELDRLAEAGVRLVAVPGNHDVGENPYGDPDGDADDTVADDYPLVSAAALDRYRDTIGPDRWFVDVGAWRLVGRDGLDHVWVPTTWAVLPDRIQPVLGAKLCGVVELTLADDGGVGVALRQPSGLAHWVIADDIADPYADG